jgi:hypothetical protein
VGSLALSADPAGAATGDVIHVGDTLSTVTATTSFSGGVFAPMLKVDNANGTAVQGSTLSGTGPGVMGEAVDGAGVYGYSQNGYGLVGGGGQAPLLLHTSSTAGPPTSGHSDIGAVMMDNRGRLYICVKTGNPGRWLRPGFNPISPYRVLDTRPGGGHGSRKLGQGTILTVAIASDYLPVPTGASAVALNLTVVDATGYSYVTIYPDGEALPLASNINFGPNQTIANAVTAKLGDTGAIQVYNNAGDVHVILDIAGFYY